MMDSYSRTSFAGMLSLKDLSDTIAVKLQECLFVGTELHGRKDDQIYPCKIVKVLENGADEGQYEVAWLDKNKKVTETAFLDAEDLVQKKPPLSRRFLKSFIRESTYRSLPWVLHDKLAQNHGISTVLPKELKSQAFFCDGLLVCNKKRKTNDTVILKFVFQVLKVYGILLLLFLTFSNYRKQVILKNVKGKAWRG